MTIRNNEIRNNAPVSGKREEKERKVQDWEKGGKREEGTRWGKERENRGRYRIGKREEKEM